MTLAAARAHTAASALCARRTRAPPARSINVHGGPAETRPTESNALCLSMSGENMSVRKSLFKKRLTVDDGF